MKLRFAGVFALAFAGLLAVAGCSEESGAQSSPTADATKNPAAAAPKPDIPQGNGFDFYVLALSWSPSYCAAEGDKADRRQCGASGPAGFVVHGLWPQFEDGYPDNCASSEPQRVPGQLASSMLDIMPSIGLVGYQWRKHGTCSGLSQRDYFAVLRAARESVRIPTAKTGTHIGVAALESAFLAANRGMAKDGIAVTCDRQRIREVRICFTRNLAFRSCRQVDRHACRQPRAALPAKSR